MTEKQNYNRKYYKRTRKFALSKAKTRYWKDPEEARRIKREEYQTVVEAREKARWNFLKRAYGVTKEDFERLLTRQHGACAICKSVPKETLNVDHNHITGKIRGLLCRACNCGIGNFKESRKFLNCAVWYLNNHEA